MEFKLYKAEGYETAIMALRMSKGKFSSWEKAQEIQDLVYAVTDSQGFLNYKTEHAMKADYILDGRDIKHNKVTGVYDLDVAEFKRLLGLTFNNAMKDFNHHTLMRYIDLTFFTDGLHRGAQDDLDAHAMRFNNRITRFSTRLAEISENVLSEWYEDKVIPIYEAAQLWNEDEDDEQEKIHLPETLETTKGTFKLTPFGYILERFAQVPAKNGLAKDVQRGGMFIGMASDAVWKISLDELRYVYYMRGKLTKANPELRLGLEQLADQIEASIPVFGPYFRMVYTDSKQWEHVNKVKTITAAEYEEYQKLKAQL